MKKTILRALKIKNLLNKKISSNKIYITQFSTPLGWMMAGAAQEGVYFLEFLDRKCSQKELKNLVRLNSEELEILSVSSLATASTGGTYLLKLTRELKEYFKGHRQKFSVPLVTFGTPFQKQVLKALLKIPYGQTLSYQEQARLAKHPKAMRAVGRCNGSNQIAIVIPCHRVIGASGKLTGYGGGLWRKEFLLGLEKRFV